jgi:prepilin-type N-terminal cleavage/methylation domain-containing protein
MRKTIKKAFTLIELLVVITIIWILATGSTAIYTSQIQKARDSTRIKDIQILKSAVVQAYQDNLEYPITDSSFSGAVSAYIDRLPTDPKSLQPWNNSGYASGKEPSLWYVYNYWSDKNWIARATYEISTAFEAAWNVKWKAKKDSWNDSNRFEIGNVSQKLDTQLKKDAKCDNTTPIVDGKALLIRWDWVLCEASKY